MSRTAVKGVHPYCLCVTDHRCTRTYTPKEDKEALSQICKDNVCRCTEGERVHVSVTVHQYR